MNANEIIKMAKEIREGRNNRTYGEMEEAYELARTCIKEESEKWAEITKHKVATALAVMEVEVATLRFNASCENKEAVTVDEAEAVEETIEESTEVVGETAKEEEKIEESEMIEVEEKEEHKEEQIEEQNDETEHYEEQEASQEHDSEVSRKNFKTVLKMMQEEGSKDPILASVRWYAVVYAKGNCQTVKYVRGMLVRRGYEIGDNNGKMVVVFNGNEVADISSDNGMVTAFDIR